MKVTKLILLFAIFSISTFVTAQTDTKKTLPDLSIKDLDGAAVNIQKYAKDGKITVVSFWATWCNPCKRELDAIAKLYPDWQKAYDVELVAITIDNARSMRKVKPMIEDKGWKYTVLSDVDQALKESLNFQTVPMTFLLDQAGNIVYEHNSYAPGDEQKLEEKIKGLVGK